MEKENQVKDEWAELRAAAQKFQRTFTRLFKKCLRAFQRLSPKTQAMILALGERQQEPIEISGDVSELNGMWEPVGGGVYKKGGRAAIWDGKRFWVIPPSTP